MELAVHMKNIETGEKRIKKCEKTLDSAYGFHHSVATMNGR